MKMDRRRFLGAAAAVAAAGLPTLAEEPTRTKFAVNLEMWWRKLPLLKRIEKAAETGFEAIEFWPKGGEKTAARAVARAGRW